MNAIHRYWQRRKMRRPKIEGQKTLEQLIVRTTKKTHDRSEKRSALQGKPESPK